MRIAPRYEGPTILTVAGLGAYPLGSEGPEAAAPIRRVSRRLTVKRDAASVRAARREVFGTPLPIELRRRLDAKWREVHALFGIPAPELGRPGDEPLTRARCSEALDDTVVTDPISASRVGVADASTPPASNL